VLNGPLIVILSIAKDLWVQYKEFLHCVQNDKIFRADNEMLVWIDTVKRI
jgi:hypothetical protein